jgi:hypothetical protein
MKATIKIVLTGVLLAFLATGCSDLFEPNDITEGNGNVTITFGAGQAGRTIRPNDITAVSAFERIELEFIKDSGADTLIKIVNVDTGTSYTTTLEQGNWNINARGFIKIEDREYEAAWGSAVVTVGSTPQNVPIVLQTGVLSDKPGVFKYNIAYPNTVTEAVLEINTLPDRYGYDIPTDGKSIDLVEGKTGSFDLLPGYYLLSLTAKTTNSMAIWNELVHIYSGRETLAEHTFDATDFSGTLTLSGTVNGGEFQGNYITKAVVTVYGDEKYLNRIASVDVSNFTKTTDSYYRSAQWSMTVPNSLAGKNVYFRVEETLGGAGGIRTYTWNKFWWSYEVGNDGIPDIDLDLSYTWGIFAYDDYSVINRVIGADGTVTVTNSATIREEWETWQQNVSFSFPVENDIRYAYEFEAWTQSGTRTLVFQHIINQKYDIFINETITIDTTRKTFTVISGTRFTPDDDRQVEFHIGYQTVQGPLYIKIKSIQPAIEYVPPAVDSTPRFTATAVPGGIRLRADLRQMPDELRGVMLFDEATGTFFSSGWI